MIAILLCYLHRQVHTDCTCYLHRQVHWTAHTSYTGRSIQTAHASYTAGPHGRLIPHSRHRHHHGNLTVPVHGQGKSSFSVGTPGKFSRKTKGARDKPA